MHKIIIASILCIISGEVAFAEDYLNQAVDIAASGMQVQSTRMKIIAENIANELSTGATPAENPYRRKVLYVKNKYNKKAKAKLLQIYKYGHDKSKFILRYDPNHPAADSNGYVKYPNVQKEIEKADSIEAQRSYEANIGVLEITKSMLQKTLEILK